MYITTITRVSFKMPEEYSEMKWFQKTEDETCWKWKKSESSQFVTFEMQESFYTKVEEDQDDKA